MHRVAVIAAILVLTAGHFAVAQTIGTRRLAIFTPGRRLPARATVWYPADPGGNPVTIGGNAVFRGTAAFQGAPVRAGRFPLVLVAFGGFRAAPDVASWLASALAERGFIAAVVNPPPIPDGKARQSVPNELWLRPADLSATITTIGKVPALARRVGTAKIGGVGFFLGGTVVLSLAGARIGPEAYAHSCDGPAPGHDCRWFARGGVDLHRVDPVRLGRSNRDPRLKAAIVVDPELTGVLTSRSLAAISVPVRVINLGPEAAIAPAFDASRVAARIPDARSVAVEDATPFDSFAECKPKGAAILRSTGGEVGLCDAGTGQARAAVHARLAGMIAGMLRQAFAAR